MRASPSAAEAAAINHKLEFAKRDAEQAQNPNYNYTMLKVRQRMVAQQFKSLFASLKGVPAEKIARLKDLMVAREMAWADARALAAKEGLSITTEGYRKIIETVSGQFDRDFEGLLGEQYSDFAALEKNRGAYAIVGLTVSPDMAYAGVPLTNDQENALAALMTQLHYSMEDPQYSGLVAQPIDANTGLSPLNQQLVEQAANLLSPAQIEVLKERQKELTAFHDLRPGTYR